MNIYESSEIKIGYWFSECCELNLMQIKDEELLNYAIDALESYNDDDGGWIGVWDNKYHALYDLRRNWLDKIRYYMLQYIQL